MWRRGYKTISVLSIKRLRLIHRLRCWRMESSVSSWKEGMRDLNRVYITAATPTTQKTSSQQLPFRRRIQLEVSIPLIPFLCFQYARIWPLSPHLLTYHQVFTMSHLRLPNYTGGFFKIAFQNPRYAKFCGDLVNLNRNIVVKRGDAEIAWKDLVTRLHEVWVSGPISLEKRENALHSALLLVYNKFPYPFKCSWMLTYQYQQIGTPEADRWWSTRAYRLGDPSINDPVCSLHGPNNI